MPKNLPNKAPLAENKGKVTAIDRAPQGGKFVYIDDTPHYVPSTQDVSVVKGQEVGKGDSLSDGIVDPRNLLRLKGMDSVQDFMTDKIHGVMKSTSAIPRRRNVEVVVRALTNLTEVGSTGDHPEWLPGDIRPHSIVSAYNKKNPKKAVKHQPILKGVNLLPLEMQEDWMARMGFNNLHRTVKEAAREGWKTNIHGFHPTPAMAYGKEFGKKLSVKDWRGQY
tara:strand:- start:203 stop:868 length:666 start_codon:yes stop_codon:yes gene_type:complete